MSPRRTHSPVPSHPRSPSWPLGLAVALTLLVAPAAALAQCEGWRPGPFSTGADGANGVVAAMAAWDPDGPGPKATALVVGGTFTSIQGFAVTNLAMRDPDTGAWVAVSPTITAPPVGALTVFEGKLVVATPGDNDVGTFDETVRTWNGSAWASLGTTNTGSVSVMHVHNGSLYVGGSFWTTNTTGQSSPARSIARWNPTLGAWDYMQTETINGSVFALASWNGELIVGGGFTIVGGNPHQGAARWTGSGWLSMGLTGGSVTALQPYIGGLYVGGGGLNDGTTNMGGLGRWSGSSWSSAGGTFGGAVHEMTVYNGRLVIYGLFGGASPNITQYDGGAYTGLGTGIGTPVYALLPFGGVLYAGGNFTTAGGLTVNRMARWNGNGWSKVGGGTASSVLAMADFRGRLIAGGVFSQSTFGDASAVNIVRWDGTSLTAMGAGMNNQVNALKSFKYPGAFGDYELIAGGYFTQAGGVGANRIARWQEDPITAFPPPAWEAMGPGMDGAVLAIERFNNTTYAGGNFWASGTTALANIGRWNESTDQWENIVGSNGPVYALKSYNGFLYAGGAFTAIGGVSTGGFARYNGTSWSAVGGFFSGAVYALEVYNGLLVIGGDYPGINSSPDLAYYNGSSYWTFGTGGSNGAVTALHTNGTRLYVGGTFSTLGGVPASYVGYWDGAWHGVSGGVNNTVYALGALGGEEHAGGAFVSASPAVWSPHWARYTATGLPWFTRQPFSQSTTAGANVTFIAQPAPGYGSVTLQWYRKGVPAVDGPTGSGSILSGSNTETLVLENVSIADAGLYKLVATNGCGSISSQEATLTVDGVTAAPPVETVLADAIEGLAPNPTVSAARFTFALAHAADVRLRVHDVAGRLVRRIAAGRLPAGRHQIEWDGRDEAGAAARTGLYFMSVESGGRSLGTRRLALQR